MLAHVLEAAGIATIVLSSVREMAEKVAPPRALQCNFPLGRPLGEPGDAEFQQHVLDAAFELLNAPSGPVLIDYPITVEATDEPLVCVLPPRFDPSLSAAADEANGLRRAHERFVASGQTTSVGRAITADQIGAALDKLQAIADGADWHSVDLPAPPAAVYLDIRTYYDEAASMLVDAPPTARAAEAWFFEHTAAGATVLAARTALRESGAKFPVWFYMAPAHR